MHALGRRTAALCVDLILSLMGAALLITPLVRMADPAVWHRFDPIPLLWAFVFVFLSIIWRGNTPGKRWSKLEVSGTGCITCRELRRSGWFLMIGIAQLFEAFTSSGVGFAGFAFAAIWIWKSVVGPLMRGENEFPHNVTTDFRVSDRT